MTLETLLQYAVHQGPFALLFIWLLYATRKEGAKREDRLHQTIDDQNEVLKNFSDKYDIIIHKLDDMEERLPRKK